MSDNRKHDELAGILLHQLRNLIDGNQARASEVVPGQYEAEDFRVRLFVLWSFSGTMEDSVTAGDVLMADHFGYNGAAFAPQALSDLLARSGAEFCGAKIPFDLNGEQAREKTHQMSYAGISTAVMLPFGLKGKTYICHAFSNPPYPYVRPTVFDDLFADELAFLQTNLSGKRKLGKKDAVAFFNRYAGQPVLDDAIRKIADCRTAQDEDTGHAVQMACQGFVSAEMAGRLANALNLIIDRVSPAYSPAVWILSGLPVLAYLALLKEWDAEQNIAARPFGTLLGGGLAFLLILLAVGIAASLLSMVVVAWQRRKVPPAYRQQMRNAEAFGKLLGWGFLVWLAACAYGFAASQDWLPKSEGRLALEVTQAACRQADGWLGRLKTGNSKETVFLRS